MVEHPLGFFYHQCKKSTFCAAPRPQTLCYMSSQGEAPDSSTSRQSTVPGTFPSPPPPSITPGLSTQRTLAHAVYNRRNEFTTLQKIRIKVGTWNVAGLEGAEKDIQGWFVQGKGVSESLSRLRLSSNHGETNQEDTKHTVVEGVVEQESRHTSKEPTIPNHDIAALPGGTDIGLYVLGLQEIVDISSAAEALRPYNDPNPSRKWRDAMSKGLPSDYVLVAEQQLSGLLLLIYASSQIAPSISSVSTTSVGTGLMGYMGNKGGTVARIVLGETTRIVFINSHLAAGTDKGSLDRRNWDASQIVQRTRFSPIDRGHGVVDEAGENIGDEDFAFWFGDLNYRLGNIPGDDVRRLLMLHTRSEYRVDHSSESGAMYSSLKKIEHELGDPKDSGRIASSRASTDTKASEDSSVTLINQDEMDPSEDPASLQTTISSLLPHDQLLEQIRTRKAFHDGWQEGPIQFLPTYKYDVGSVGMFDSSEKKRSPSWCDRILYRTRNDYLKYLEYLKQMESSKKRDQEMKARGLENDAIDEIVFDYDPETDGADEEYDENGSSDSNGTKAVPTKLGYEDNIHLDYYTSHQRILSSDHKPLDAVFTLAYEAIDPMLRAKVHQELARELDKTENETRPSITIVVDHSEEGSEAGESIDFKDIRYDELKSQVLTIANTSPVPATFGFAERGDGTVCPAWLQVAWSRTNQGQVSTIDSHKQYTLEPGDSTNLELIAHVFSLEEVRAFNLGKSKPEDVLVLRVHDGRDHFIPIRATWLKSSFGMSLQKMVRVPESGIRSQNQNTDQENEEPRWSAPRELFRLTEALEEILERAVAEWGMKDGEQSKPPWETAGWPFISNSWRFSDSNRESAKLSIRESLDTGSPMSFPADLTSDQKVEILAETLLVFLSSIDGGIIDDSLWQSLSSSVLERERSKRPLPSAEDQRAHILDIISNSPARSVSFTFITFMLARVVNELEPLQPPGELLPASPVVSPKTPDALLKRARGMSSDPRIVRRKEVEKKYATVFAGCLFSVKEEKGWKEKRAAEERRREFVEVFLRSRWEDGI